MDPGRGAPHDVLLANLQEGRPTGPATQRESAALIPGACTCVSRAGYTCISCILSSARCPRLPRSRAVRGSRARSHVPFACAHMWRHMSVRLSLCRVWAVTSMCPLRHCHYPSARSRAGLTRPFERSVALCTHTRAKDEHGFLQACGVAQKRLDHGF